jgi:hypothetical protein
MTTSTDRRTRATSKPGSGLRDVVSLRDIASLLECTVSSAEPAVVFSSVARRCVPDLCVKASIAISEAGERTYSISYPLAAAHSPAGIEPGGPASFGDIRANPDIVFTDVHGDASESYSAYEGVLAMQFAHTAPTDAMVGQLIVASATALIHNERLRHTAQIERTRATNLEIGWRTNREIGMAIGIVMKLRRLTEQNAFDLLRRISQDTQRKIRDIALDIVTTGEIDFTSRVSSRSDPHR